MTTNLPFEEGSKLAVTLAGHSERMQALLNAYLMGPGRRLFALRDEAQAQAMIADFDNPAARLDLARFQASYRRPGIVLALRNPGLAGTVWVGKPIEFEALAAAAVLVQEMLRQQAAALAAAGHGAPAGQVQQMAAKPDAGADAGRVLAFVASAIPGAREGAMPAAAVQPTPPRAGEALPVGQRRDWTGKVAWLAAAAFGGVAVTSLLGGLPAVEGLWQRAAMEAAALPTATEKALQEAVLASQREYRAQSDAERQYVTLQLDELQSRESAEDLQARLDRLARDPAALAAHNRNVMNRIQIESGGASAEDMSGRAPVEAAVSDSLKTLQDASAAGFVNAIRPEAQQRVAEMRTIVVAKGDTLGTIAARAYGSSTLYPLIFAANPRVLTSPHHIYPGQVLRVPRR